MTTSPMPQTADMDELLTVGQVAERFGVTVRTLHHYDERGLLRPSERSAGGYRLYSGHDLERLATIVLYRRLDFSIEEIAALLDSDRESRAEQLRRQRERVSSRLAQMTDLAIAIDHALEVEMNERPATTEELSAIFGDGFDEEYQAEAQERWGDTERWAESQRRTATWSASRWEEVKAEVDALERDLADAARRGVAPDSVEGSTLAERHRASIAQYYECDHAFQVCLAQMYLADERFTAHYEALAPGLTQWLHDAIVANAERA